MLSYVWSTLAHSMFTHRSSISVILPSVPSALETRCSCCFLEQLGVVFTCQLESRTSRVWFLYDRKRVCPLEIAKSTQWIICPLILVWWYFLLFQEKTQKQELTEKNQWDLWSAKVPCLIWLVKYHVKQASPAHPPSTLFTSANK